jgi:c(7)-type cytochrome triheme protein
MKKIISALLFVAVVPALAFSQAAIVKGDITFTLKNAASVTFSHDYHIKTRGVKCSACHFQTFATSGESYQMKREKLTKRDFCEHCHNGMKGFDARSEKNCTRCHKQ